MMVIVLFHRPFSIDHSMFVCVCTFNIYYARYRSSFRSMHNCLVRELVFVANVYSEDNRPNTTIRRVFIEFKLGENFVFKETRKTPLHTAPLIILNLATVFF